jgi:hypothetical protein
MHTHRFRILPPVLAFTLIAAIMPAAAQDAPVGTDALTLTPLGTFAHGSFDEGASEITAYHPATQQLYVVNGEADALDILSIADPAAPTLVSQISIEDLAEGLTHVAVFGDLVAVAVENGTAPGGVVFMQPDGAVLGSVEVGSLPDMLVFTPDGTRVLTANEGEPSDDYSEDPEGSISIIDLSAGVETARVTTLTFSDSLPGAADARVYGPNATFAQDMEPEFITVSPDGTTAFVTLQENNAVAVVSLETNTITALVPLGFKDHSLPENALDASNEDGAINITTHPLLGMYQPDAIASLEVGGVVYLFTANEGDTRDYDGYSEEGEVSELTLDAAAFPDAAAVQAEAATGKAEVTTTLGDTDGDGDYDALYIPGARSFSVWADGALVWDSGSAFEQITAAAFPDDFNATNDENGSFDDRSDNKGPEPEGLVLGAVGDAVYAFIGLERIGGVMVYDVTDPTAPVFVSYTNPRDFSGDAEAGTAGDLGPEGLLFIPAETSPTGDALLVVANEISGTTTIYSISP